MSERRARTPDRLAHARREEASVSYTRIDAVSVLRMHLIDRERRAGAVADLAALAQRRCVRQRVRRGRKSTWQPVHAEATGWIGIDRPLRIDHRS